MEAADAPQLERAAHTLKGAVGNFAAMRAFEAAQRLEHRGRAGDLAGVAGDLAQLEQELDAARPALAELVLVAEAVPAR